MTDITSTLERFLRGELESSALTQELAATVAREPQRAAELLAAIEAPYRAGRLPQPLYLMLRAAIESPAPVDADDEAEHTRIAPISRTHPPVPEDDAERTRVASVHVTGRTAPAATQSTTQNTRNTAQNTQNTAQPTGQQPTGSSWGNPAQWQGNADEDVTLTVGSVIKGRFVLESIIGKGGMGLVYKARDLRKEEAQDRNPHIAVKLLNDDFKRHPESLKALQREARKAQNLAHPNIVNVFDFDRDGGNVYMTMEFLDGDPLDKLIKRIANKGMPVKEAMPLIEGMSNALSYAHKKNIIHSDFKPGNVFLTQDNTIKVFDFGIARAAKRPDNAEGETTMFDAGTLGALTPAYASCEMLDGEEPDARDDIYALACVAYELFAGKHPFNKLSATQARDNKLLPAPIKGLSRRQMRGLLRGLAFSRDQRSSSVDQFLDDLSAKQGRLGLGIGGGVALLIVIGLLARGPVESYIQKQNTDRIIAAIRSNKDSEVESGLAQISHLEREQRDTITRELRDDIIGYYEKKIDDAIDSGQGHYHYPAAEDLLKRAKALYPDSAKLESIITHVDQRKNQQLNELNAKFNDYLEQGRLLPRKDAEDINDVLAIVAQIDPKHPLLKDPRLPSAYATAADQAMRDQQFDRAGEVLAAGLKLFPQDARMIDLQDKAKVAQQRVARAGEIAGLQQQLAGAQLNSLDDFAALRDKAVRLKELDAENPAVASLRTRLQALLDADLDKKLAAHDWNGGTALLDKYADFLAADAQSAKRAQIKEARSRYDAGIDGLFAAIDKAVQAQHLDAPAKDNALELLKQAQATVPDDVRIAQSKAAIAQGYLQQAREARGRKDWQQARDRVQRGLAMQPGASVQASLEAENKEITSAEQGVKQQVAQAGREQQAKELQGKIDALHTQYQTQLKKTPFAVADAGALLKTLDQIAALSPTDTLVTQGREQVAGRISDEARAQAAAGQWDAAVKLLQDGQGVIPESAQLSRTLTELRQTRQTQLAQQQKDQFAKQQADVQALLNKPEFTDDWDNKLNDQLHKLAAQLPANDPWLSKSREQAARAYLAKSKEMHLAQRFTEANSLLDRAKRYADLPELATERQAIAADEAKFEAENQEKNRLAQLQGLQQTLLTQAKANDVKNAKISFDKLRTQLPAGDKFLTQTAPQALGEAYLRMAERLAARQQFQNALKLANSGLEVAPELQSLKDAVTRYNDQLSVQTLRDAIGATPFKADAFHQGMIDLKTKKPDQYAALEKEFAQAFKARIEKQAQSDFSGAQSLLHEAQKALPGNALLSSLVLTPPAAPTAATTAPATTPAETAAAKAEVKKPAAGTSTEASATASAPSGPDTCSASFAGYGRVARATCSDILGSAGKGPVMVVVPAGAGFAEPFAIGKYEVSVGDFSIYCRVSGKCTPPAHDAQLPITHVSAAQAEEYAKWLSKITGHSYRLPTDQEWTYAANAQGKQPEKDFNCLLRLGDQVIKGLSLIDVKSGKSNGWGLLNYVGNAQEWVTSGGGFSARGGDFQDTLSSCDITLDKPSSGAADDVTGFRLVREVQSKS
jgi:serine/threonine protein kinase